MNGTLRLGIVLVGALAVVALLAPVLAPYDPIAHLEIDRGSLPPSLAHPLGTDSFSRDLLSRVLYGARLSLSIAGIAVLLSMTVGTAVGLVAGFHGGWVDAVLMRVVDTGLAIPRVFLLLAALALWDGVSALALVLVLGLTGWFGTSRLVRAEVQSVRERDFVAAARAAGVGPIRLMLRHILPNVTGPIIVSATLGVGYVILVEAGLSYLGLGVPQPTPSWGSIIREGQSLLVGAPWISAAGGAAVVLTVMSFTVLGDGLQRRLDPRRA